MTKSEVKGGWWRWPLMPLASVLGAGLGSVVANVALLLLMKLFGGGQPDGIGFTYVLPAMSYGVFGYIFSIVAYSLSPSHKLVAGILMSISMVAFILLALLSALSTGAQAGLTMHLMVGAVSAAMFSAIALFQSHHRVLELGANSAGP